MLQKFTTMTILDDNPYYLLYESNQLEHNPHNNTSYTPPDPYYSLYLCTFLLHASLFAYQELIHAFLHVHSFLRTDMLAIIIKHA